MFKGSKHSMYVQEDIAISIIMQSRLSNLKMIKLRSDLGFNQINLILKKEQSVVTPLLKAVFAEKIELQHKALKNRRVRTDMYFCESKFVVEIDEKGHTDRNQNEENERRIKIKEHINCKCHRINPDAEGFDIFLEISKIQTYITQSNKKKRKGKIAKELLNYISIISKPLKHIKYFVKKILLTLQNMKNTQSKTKQIKTRKDIGTTYCLGCKDYTHNFVPQEIKMTNKALREKSDCVVCRSSKSRFLKQKHNNKK